MSISPDQLQKLLDALQFGNTYPGFAPVSPSEQGGPASSPPSALQQRVVSALQGVLGRTFKEGDYRSFRVALEASFEVKEVGGRQTYEWKPRAYPLTGGSDLGGGISGAQYSLVSLANVLYEQTTDLVDNLYSLIPDVDEEQLDAARAVFRTTWSEFINELGREGGPRVQRADALSDSMFEVRIDQAGKSGQVPTAKGHLVRFGRLLGMVSVDVVDKDLFNKISADITLAPRLVSNSAPTDRPVITRFNVLTTEEEENLTNFIALIDIYLTVRQSWRSYRDTFLQASVERDLGTGLLSLERLFAVLEESVSEVYIAMDSVNVDQAERLVLPADPDDPTGIKVEDLLSWVSTFASTEAPGLVRDGGKWGVEAVLDTTKKLRALADRFLGWLSGTLPVQTLRPDPPPAFRHTRVTNPVNEMSKYLKLIEDTARQIGG